MKLSEKKLSYYTQLFFGQPFWDTCLILKILNDYLVAPQKIF